MSPGHRSYLEAVVEHLRRVPTIFSDPFHEVEPYLEAALTLAMLDLEPARAILEPCYCHRKGGKSPRDPIAMFRCTLLMGMVCKGSPNRWARKMN